NAIARTRDDAAHRGDVPHDGRDLDVLILEPTRAVAAAWRIDRGLPRGGAIASDAATHCASIRRDSRGGPGRDRVRLAAVGAALASGRHALSGGMGTARGGRHWLYRRDRMAAASVGSGTGRVGSVRCAP